MRTLALEADDEEALRRHHVPSRQQRGRPHARGRRSRLCGRSSGGIGDARRRGGGRYQRGAAVADEAGLCGGQGQRSTGRTEAAPDGRTRRRQRRSGADGAGERPRRPCFAVGRAAVTSPQSRRRQLMARRWGRARASALFGRVRAGASFLLVFHSVLADIRYQISDIITGRVLQGQEKKFENEG